MPDTIRACLLHTESPFFPFSPLFVEFRHAALSLGFCQTNYLDDPDFLRFFKALTKKAPISVTLPRKIWNVYCEEDGHELCQASICISVMRNDENEKQCFFKFTVFLSFRTMGRKFSKVHWKCLLSLLSR